MKTNSINNVDNKSVFKGRIGRLDIGNGRIFNDMLRNVEEADIKTAEIKLNRDRIANANTPEGNFLIGIKERLFGEKRGQTLADFWTETISKIKTAVIEKLPDEYVLKNSRSKLAPYMVGFNLERAGKRIYSVVASIMNPKFAEEYIGEAATNLSHPEYIKKFNALKTIFPEMTEEFYLDYATMFLKPEKTAQILDLNKQLRAKTEAKNLKLTMEAKEDHKLRIFIQDKRNKRVYEEEHPFKLIEEHMKRVNKMLDKGEI